MGKRTHTEVVAAREAYAKERHEKQVAKEAKRAEREKLIAERAQRRAEREARKAMTPEEARQDRQRKQFEKAKSKLKRNTKDNPSYVSYKGDINVGDFVAAIFAGSPVRGTIVGITKGSAADLETEDGEEAIQFRKGAANVQLYNIKNCDDNFIYPVRRESIVAKR